MTKKNLIYALLTLAILVVGYAFIRIAYNFTDKFPFTQEIVVVFLGTVATIFITSLLLNKQTSVEIEKEYNIRHLELKFEIYNSLLNLLEEMSLLEKFSKKEIIRLQFITHKLSIVASPEVVETYQDLLSLIKELAQDESFSGELPLLHQSISELIVKIRQDMLNIGQDKLFSAEKLKTDQLILNSSNKNLLKKK